MEIRNNGIYHIPVAFVKPTKVTAVKETVQKAPKEPRTTKYEPELDPRRISEIEAANYNFQVPYYYGFLGLVGLVIGPILSTMIVLIPHRDLIQYPDHWYEYTLLLSMGLGFGMSINFGLVQPTYWILFYYTTT